MSKKKRSFEPQPLRKVLPASYCTAQFIKGLNEVKVKLAWEKTVGKHVMQYTTDIKLRGKTLYVHLNSAPLREELNYGKEKS